MTPIQVIYYTAFPVVILSISGVKTTRNTNNELNFQSIDDNFKPSAHTDLITIGYSWQYATSNELLRKLVSQFGLSVKIHTNGKKGSENSLNNLENETQIFRIMTSKMEQWKYLLESHTDVDVELIPWPQEQTVINIYKTCDEMNLAEFTLLYDIVNTTRNSLFIIDSDSESSDRINILIRTATKCNLCTQSADRIFSTIYFCNDIVSNNWINKLGRMCDTAVLSLPNGFRRDNTVHSLMPRIFISATEYKHHNRFYHSPQRSNGAHKTYQDSRGNHLLSRHRRNHRISTKKYKFLKLYREQETRRKIRKQASDVLKVPTGRRKLLCKYRKSCYNTGIIPNTWNINNILPRIKNSHEQENFSEKENITEMHIKNENEEKEEISEAELKLLCRYRKSCYEEMGAEIENTLKIQTGSIFSRDITILPATKQKSTKEIARMALAKLEEKERIAALRPISTKAITEKNLNEIVEETKKRLACKYRISCYDSGVLPKIDISFDNLFHKIHLFVRGRDHQAGIRKIIYNEFYDFNDDEKKVYCKYRKSCYDTGQKPVINHGEIFKYIHIVKKYEEVIPLGIRCKYRKSCYDTGILPDLKKKVPEETPSVVLVQEVTSIYHLKTLCKYRKSCYKRKAEEQQNFNIGVTDEAETLGEDESERKKEKQREIKKVIKSFQKELVIKAEKIAETSAFKKKERAFEMRPTRENNSKKLIKKWKVLVPELEGKRMAAVIENKKSEGTIYKPKKRKTQDLVEKTPIRQASKLQTTILSTKIMEKSIREKKAPGPVEPKQDRLKPEKLEEEIRIKNEKTRKGKKISIALEKDFENEPLTIATEIPPSLPIKEVQSIFLQAENITPSRKYIYDENLSPLNIKLLCKYRKSCYENGKLPSSQTVKTAQDFHEKEDHGQLELRCKYRKSCYETGMLPEKLHEKFKETHLTNKKEEHTPNKYIPEEHIPLTLKCKYRKSCYETGKLPPIETNIFGFSTIQILNEYKESVTEINREQVKLSCKYRKSCYESGILPLHLNHTAYAVTNSIKRYDSLQLRCKYRKSCFENMELDIQLEKVRKKEEQKRMQEGMVKAPYQMETTVKYKEKEQKKEVREEATKERSKRTQKKKSKELKDEIKEQQYMQIKPLDSQSRQRATKLRPLNSAQKLKCKYRLKCYNGVLLHEVAEEKRVEKQRQLSIKDFRRANGAICNIYYISCRKQAGLPIIGRAPIGPNGRRLCRKKKKEISD